MKKIIHQIRVDANTVIRKRVPFEDDMCDICGFSVCRRNNLLSFSQLSEIEQEKVKKALAEHKRVAHTPENTLVVDDSMLPKQHFYED